MPCYSPLTAFYGEKGASGKRKITFQRANSFSGAPLRLPCGQCVGCRLEKSRQWAMRCLHEKKLHEHNAFVTLTYADEFLPVGGTLVKEDFQKFMKRLRFAKHPGIRFYACGEYGDESMRPHYHAILFNCEFNDLKLLKRTKRGDAYYISKELEELWPYGNNVVAAVTFETAAYVARYVMKKITGRGLRNGEAYQVTDTDGIVHVRAPEFCLMSRRPGIGAGWYQKFGDHTMTLDSVVINEKEVRPPRYYDSLYERVDPARMAMLKARRRRMAIRLGRADQTPERRRVREGVAYAALQTKERSL